MRIISQDSRIDLPYNRIMFCIEGVLVTARNDGKQYLIGKYSTEEKAIKAMKMCIEKYQGFLQKVIACLTIRRYSGFQQMMRFRERGRNERAKQKESDNQKADERGKDI
ncbi:hypothetical protein [Mediterraneibacter faecis]|uniref:hypothetical protein n=1 Tax=Mediterraneibacter faecis TaxID=592978 RepID=UPI003F9EAC15